MLSALEAGHADTTACLGVDLLLDPAQSSDLKHTLPGLVASLQDPVPVTRGCCEQFHMQDEKAE